MHQTTEKVGKVIYLILLRFLANEIPEFSQSFMKCFGRLCPEGEGLLPAEGVDRFDKQMNKL